MKKNVLKRATALGLSFLMLSSFTGCGKSGNHEISQEAGDINDKPEDISMMVDTTMTFENGLQKVCDEFQKRKDISLTIEKPDHNKYYEKVTLSFASENAADIIEMGSTYYPQLANSGVLWDMTDSWNNSALKASGIVEEQYVDALKIDVGDGKGPRLYGFPMAAGNGTCTYVRQDWLDELITDGKLKFANGKTPSNYEEFIAMLQAFKDSRPTCIPLTAAGLIQAETPYDIYLREFYQDAIPDFYYNEATGTYVDGFGEDAMLGDNGAVARLKAAYDKDLIDREIVTNKTSTCRDKVGSGMVGAFNYWAGMWSKKLNKSLGKKGKLTAIPPIQEIVNSETGVRGYTERVPTAFAMSCYADKKGATFEHMICYSHDGGEGQMLFTHGVEGEDPEVVGIKSEKAGHYHYTEGNAADVGKPGAGVKAEAWGYLQDLSTPVEKSFYAPELTITNWEDPIALDPLVSESLGTFRQARAFASVPIVTDVIAENLSDFNDLKNQAISSIVTGGSKVSVAEGREKYKKDSEYYVTAILEDLNDEERLANVRQARAAK